MCCGDVPLLTIDDSGHLRGLEDVVELLAGVGSDDQSRVVAAVRRARELKRRNRMLEQENEVLRRAAAYLSQANLPG
ncbi:hypothetical protein, partial [Janibacter indicus]|uniref:hypothetical protein n=1 Tax=Janibacter indicus TaxID=857417 RepID=UPI001F1F704C